MHLEHSILLSYFPRVVKLLQVAKNVDEHPDAFLNSNVLGSINGTYYTFHLYHQYIYVYMSVVAQHKLK